LSYLIDTEIGHLEHFHDQNKIGYSASEFIRGDKQDYSSFASPQIHLWGQSKIQNPKSEWPQILQQLPRQ
jgi:hypothetical protein